MSDLRRRYPGARPFEPDQQHVFFGREKDIESLSRLIRLEPLVILYGKSGTGKSSLLNAGIIPRMAEEAIFDTIRIRFNVWQEDSNLPMPVANIRSNIQQNFELRAGILDELVPDDYSLWKSVKSHHLSQEGSRRLLLLFDQFEELFTYPAEMVKGFRQQLAETLYTDLPQRYWDALLAREKPGDNPLETTKLALLQKPSSVRVVFAVRSDRLHLLHQLSDFLPLILQNCYELGALDEQRARDAIVLPAGAPGAFVSAPFHYSNDAVGEILRFLTHNGEEKIETTQLQIVANSIEDKVIRTNNTGIEKADLGDLEEVIANYYAGKIAEIDDPDERLRARKLIEEGLVFEEEERRLSLYEGQIYRIYGLQTETLQRLVDVHLLRAEPSLQGGFSYELSHDTLVGPVLEAKAERVSEEKRMWEAQQKLEQEAAMKALQQKAEEERERAEKERMLREQAEQAQQESERQKRRALWLAAIALLAFMLALYLYFLTNKANLEIARKAAASERNSAQSYKVQGMYREALDRLESIQPYLTSLQASERDSLERLKIEWQKVQQYMMAGDSLFRLEDLRNAILQYELARSNTSADRHIEQVLSTARNDLEIKFKRYKENGETLMRSRNYQLASENFSKALNLKDDPEIVTMLEICIQQLQKKN